MKPKRRDDDRLFDGHADDLKALRRQAKREDREKKRREWKRKHEADR